MDHQLSERPPPKQYFKFEAVNGEKKISISWEPRTGVLQLARLGSEGNAIAISKRFKLFEKQRVADVIRISHDWMSAIFDDEELVDAATRIVGGIVSGMRAILPDGQEKEREQ